MTVCPACGLPERSQAHCDRYDCPLLAMGPTPERYQHGPIDAHASTDKKILLDPGGRATMAPRAVDTLGRMLRRGLITVEMAKAGATFRANFRKAQFQELRCSDSSRPAVSGLKRVDAFDVDARNAVWDMMALVGGTTAPAGSCLWSVIGHEQSLQQWATEKGWSHETATGILIAALGVLSQFEDGK